MLFLTVCVASLWYVHEPLIQDRQEPQQRPRFEFHGITITADQIIWTAEPSVRRFEGNVVAEYDVTRLTAEEAELNETERTASFKRGVKLTDPIGTLECESILVEFDSIGEQPEEGEAGVETWRMRRAIAKGIQLVAHEARLSGEELELLPEKWVMRNVLATMCDRDNPDYSFFLREITFRPGRDINAKNVTFKLGEWLAVDIPFFRVGLDPAQTGLQSPTLTYSDGFRFGYKWRNVFTVGSHASFIYEQSAFRHDAVPSTNAVFAFTDKPRPVNELDTMISIRNEDGERFLNGFTDNIIVASIEEELRSIGRSQNALFVGRTTNFATVARVGSTPALDRDWFVGVDSSGKGLGFPAQLQVKYGSIKERLTPNKSERWEIYGTAIPIVFPISENAKFFVRADAGMFAGGGNKFGWLRTSTSFSIQNSPALRSTISYVHGASSGTPLFDADRLYSSNALHLRMDFDLPATGVSLLLKYDFDRKDLYDIELHLSQIAHCVTPFVNYRRFPGMLTFGFKVRADELFDSLKRRDLKRETIGRS